MKLIVLGAAAGGGFPQWNSNAPLCRRARGGDRLARRRTQASLALSADDRRWLVVNAAPDILSQIAATPALHPKQGLRSTPIAAVLLTGGDVDCIAGLLSLRERQRFVVYATQPVLEMLDANPIFEVLGRDCVERRPLPLSGEFEIEDADGVALGMTIETFAVPGKTPLYLETGARDPSAIAEDGGTIGISFRENGATVTGHYIPGCARMTDALAQRLRGEELVFFDGTLWSDDEMIRAGIGAKTGARMGHMSVGGPAGTMAAFAALDVRRKILIHINNSNPVLDEGSPEHAEARAAGWDVAHDGLELTL